MEKTNFDKFILPDESKKRIIANPDIFKIAHTPSSIVERVESINLFREVATFLNYRKPNNVLVTGPPGTGKTVTVKFVLNRIKNISPLNEKFQVFNVNCASKAPNDILSVLNNQPASKQPFEEGMQAFISSLDKDTLIVLDEVDRGYKLDSLLFQLSRTSELYTKCTQNISLILISNNLHWEEQLSDSTRSSLQLKKIPFNPYKKEKLKEIIDQRISLGFVRKDAISTELIEMICEDTVKKRLGDCRVVIETVFYAAQEAETQGKSEISYKNINNARKIVTDTIDRERIGKLKDNQLMTLFCCVFKEERSLGEFYSDYMDMTRAHNLKVQSAGMIFHILQYLNDMGFIEKSQKVTKIAGKPPKRIMNIQCQVSEEVLLTELTLRDLRLSRGKYEKRE